MAFLFLSQKPLIVEVKIIIFEGQLIYEGKKVIWIGEIFVANFRKYLFVVIVNLE